MGNKMRRFWTSFWAADMRSIGGDPGHTFFCSGFRQHDETPECMIVLAEAESEEAVWAAIKSPLFYPEAEERAIEEVGPDFHPNAGGRFPGIHLWQVNSPQQQGPLV